MYSASIQIMTINQPFFRYTFQGAFCNNAIGIHIKVWGIVVIGNGHVIRRFGAAQFRLWAQSKKKITFLQG